MSTNEQDNQVLLNQIALEYLKEQKRKRRWKWLFRLFMLAFVVLAILNINKLGETRSSAISKPHAGLIDINGEIAGSSAASANNLAKSLYKAYKDKSTKAIVLRINSPGGSPVQADYMFNTISYYRKKYPKIKVYAVCVDSCTSAAYYVASAAEKIYANPASVVGSIGVLYNGFGFVNAIEKLGIQRRLITAGKNKGFLDPFSKINPQQKADLEKMLDIIHKQFEGKVKLGRGERLQINDNTFSGLFWTGEQAKTMGLIDDFASSGEVVREQFKLEHTIDYTIKPNYFEKFAKNFGYAMADRLISAASIQSSFKA